MQKQIDYIQAIFEKNKEFDGTFVYGVRSTRIYCRPSCPSKKPSPDNIAIFPNSSVAEKDGYRSCLRCNPNGANTGLSPVKFIEHVCRYIEAQSSPPSLKTLGLEFDMSPYHLQRLFKSALGVSPRQYADELRLARFRRNVVHSDRITNAQFESGYNSSSTLYGGISKKIGMKPCTYKSGGKSLKINFAIVSCALGRLLVACTEKGICRISLGDVDSLLIDNLKREFPHSTVTSESSLLHEKIKTLLSCISGQEPHCDLPLDVRGTAFQRRVWEELRRIPSGETRSYQEIAQCIGRPKAARAVANACANNPTALIVPCHRVIRTDGGLGGYRWGLSRKQALLTMEKLKNQS